MGKSIRCKIKKRLRTAKRQRIDAMIITPRENEKHDRLVRLSQGRAVTLCRPKNAFKYPDADDAVFPQHEVIKPIDFRAQNLPMAGLVFRGNRRKYTAEEAEMIKHVVKTQHPKMEVLAGGGAVHAKTGRKVSIAEAELIATRVNLPEVAKIAESKAPETEVASLLQGDATATPAVSSTAPQVDEKEAESDAEMEKEEVVPENQVDTSRRPVVKDLQRVKRVTEGKSRPNSVKKGANKMKPQAKGKAKAT